MDTLLNWSLPIFICISGIAYFYIWNKRKELEKENVQTLVNPYEGMGVKELLDKVLRDMTPLMPSSERVKASVGVVNTSRGSSIYSVDCGSMPA